MVEIPPPLAFVTGNTALTAKDHRYQIFVAQTGSAAKIMNNWQSSGYEMMFDTGNGLLSQDAFCKQPAVLYWDLTAINNSTGMVIHHANIGLWVLVLHTHGFN